jgi:hypothetical protein
MMYCVHTAYTDGYNDLNNRWRFPCTHCNSERTCWICYLNDIDSYILVFLTILSGAVVTDCRRGPPPWIRHWSSWYRLKLAFSNYFDTMTFVTCWLKRTNSRYVQRSVPIGLASLGRYVHRLVRSNICRKVLESVHTRVNYWFKIQRKVTN